MSAARELARGVPVSVACRGLDVSRASYYRALRPKPSRTVTKRLPPKRALSSIEKQRVLDILHCEEFIDQAPASIFNHLLDRGEFYCSVRTMYRILHENDEVRERRNQRRHTKYTKPELLATKPNQVWSWDITKLKAPQKWHFYYLYVILDIYSRYVVGWTLGHRESSTLARHLILTSCEKQAVAKNTLKLHSDRGSSMTSKTVATLLSELGVSRSLNRPYVKNDNPFSESQFKTLKYRPQFPKRFGSFEDARSFCQQFFRWYNNEHLHSSIGYFAPANVHYNRSQLLAERRQQRLQRAYEERPDRFVNGPPKVSLPPAAVWINPPTEEAH